ncbi:MAG: hypothetical protein ACLP7Q_15785 [Isosphaeraceae bacterium]
MAQAIPILVLQSQPRRTTGLQSQEDPGPAVRIEEAQGSLVLLIDGQYDLRVLRTLMAELKDCSVMRIGSDGKERSWKSSLINEHDASCPDFLGSLGKLGATHRDQDRSQHDQATEPLHVAIGPSQVKALSLKAFHAVGQFVRQELLHGDLRA